MQEQCIQNCSDLGCSGGRDVESVAGVGLVGADGVVNRFINGGVNGDVDGVVFGFHDTPAGIVCHYRVPPAVVRSDVILDKGRLQEGAPVGIEDTGDVGVHTVEVEMDGVALAVVVEGDE